MKLRLPSMFVGAFLLLAGAYAAAFVFAVTTDAQSVRSRFDALRKGAYPGVAANYGDRLIALKREEGVDADALAPLKAEVADVALKARRYARAAKLVEEALATDWAKTLSEQDRATLEEQLGRTRIISRDMTRAAQTYAEFLDRAGDAAVDRDIAKADSIEAFYAGALATASPLFTEALKPAGAPELFAGDADLKLIAAQNLSALGAFYALDQEGRYAAAGLLASALALRKEILGADHQDTIQIALMLGPIYQQLGRLEDAERLYLDAFHAQEAAKGSNSPELSLYIKLLAGIYEAQGRATEAQALNEHMRGLFRDAFGSQRYAANRVRDRRLDIDRPVSQYFLLPATYAPADLVKAAAYSIPLSKDSGVEEMKVRLAADPDEDPREANLPVRLAQLISLCRAESGETVSLRSGYRSYPTQKDLYARIGHKGTVTPPGMSEHQLGLATDIDVGGRLMRPSDKTFQCFEENAFRFGFVLSYPPGNDYLPGADTYEPWHWRYVGIRTAQLYREIGPLNKPQEFLAALPCYQAQAVSGVIPPVGEPNPCLELKKQAKSAAKTKGDDTSGGGGDGPGRQSARKLNNGPTTSPR